MLRVINSNQLYRKMNSYIDSAFGTPAPERFVLVEVGTIAAYSQLHIKSAIHMSLETIQKNPHPYFPNPGAEIVVYGESALSLEPRLAIRGLFQKGFSQIYFYRGGKEDWLIAGLDTQTSLVPADGLSKATESLPDTPIKKELLHAV